VTRALSDRQPALKVRIRHMGNVLLEDLQREINAGGVIAGVGVSVAAAGQTVGRAFAYTPVARLTMWSLTLTQVALVSLVCAFAFLSGCGSPYGSLGGFSETKIAPATYRVSFSPYGYTPWDLAYQAGLLRCATLTMQNGYRYFGVLAIENYGSGNSFSLLGKSANAGGFYNANTAYNPPQSFSIIWPQPVLTIRMLKDPIPGVTLDAEIIRNRGMTEIRR
jgi:hypothetical protein